MCNCIIVQHCKIRQGSEALHCGLLGTHESSRVRHVFLIWLQGTLPALPTARASTLCQQSCVVCLTLRRMWFRRACFFEGLQSVPAYYVCTHRLNRLQSSAFNSTSTTIVTVESSPCLYTHRAELHRL